jgi:hypothetical protein
MPSAEFEPAIPARERRQTHALDRAATSFYFRRKKYAVIWLNAVLVPPDLQHSQ